MGYPAGTIRESETGNRVTGKIPLLIDTDPGVDDALALLMAFGDRAHDIVGLTVAAGNVGLRHTVANALKLCDVAGRDDVPVFAGCAQPLLHAAPDAAYVHGRTGSATPATRLRRARPRPSTPRWRSCACRTSTRAGCCWSRSVR